MSGSRTSINTATATPSSHTNNNSTNNYYEPAPQRHTPATVNASTGHGYSDSTLSSGRGSDDGRGSSYYSHSRQESDIYGSSHGSHDGHLSSGDELHSRNGSHDSSDYSLTSVGRRGIGSSGRQPQVASRRVEANYHSMESSTPGTYLTSTESIYSAVSQHSNYPGQRRQFATMEYTPGSMPATGNIALELLKQTQNTKYLLGQEPPVSAQNSASTTPGLGQISEGAAYGGMAPPQAPPPGGAGVRQDGQRFTSRDDTYPRRKESSQVRKGYSGKKHLDSSPMSSNNSSPRSSSKNLSGMSSEESLNSRLRQQRGTSSVGSSHINFQEELKRLIDPDISESDLASLASQSRPPPNRRGRRLQRTFSDESLHSTKGTITTASDISIGTDVIFTSALPSAAADTSTGSSDHTTSERLSPRAVLDANRPRNRRTVDGRHVPITDTTTVLDWSNLVNVATKAMESDERPARPPPHVVHADRHRASDDEPPPPPRPPSPKDDVSLSSASSMAAAWVSMATTPEQRIKELETLVQKLQKELEKERERSAKQDAEIQDLRADNVRLQEESQTAAAQLRRFTEWFFNTIDRQ
nr:hypothetical protein BaRGS_007020 [Batillaria attramentaria]